MRLPRITLDRRAALAVLGALTLLAIAPAAGGATVPRVRVPFPQADGTLTPYTFELGYPLMMLVYDSLMWRDPRGVPRPWLARSVTHRGDTVVVHLRRGVRWQDGVPLTAADVVFTYRYMATHPHPRFTPELADLVDVEATGPGTVVFRLRAPSLGFEDQPLADVPIIPQHLWQGLPTGQLAPAGLPIGSGPYRLASYSPKSGYRFLANQHYFRATPAVREIDVPIIHDAQAMFDSLANDTADAVPLELAPDELDSVSGNLGVKVVTGDNYTGTVLLLNTAATPFDSPANRVAVAEAIDQQAIAAAIGAGGESRLVIPADRGMIDPASPWAPPRPLRSYAPNDARVQLVGQGEPPITVLAPDNDPRALAAGQQVVRQLVAIGARAGLRSVTPGELDRAVGVNGYSPSYQAAIWSTPDLVSEDPSFLDALFGPPLRTPLNYSGYSSASFDAAAAAVEGAATPASRRRAVARELSVLAREVPAVPLYFTRGAYAYRPSVYDGWVYVKGTGILDKQSFLGAGAGPAAAAAAAPPPGAVGSGQDSGASVLLYFGIGIACVLALAVAWRLYASRSVGRARSRSRR
jgi:peptide/nickel transport system substrate-binding protein